VNLLGRLWANEPVIVKGGLSLAVSAGVLTATQASGVGDAVATLVSVAGLFLARRSARPANPSKK
jgi:hypothetical protein